MVRYLKQENFDEQINGDLILVDFFADWCGPCKMMGTVLDNVDFVDVLKVNVDEFPELARQFGVMSIPTLCFFKDGILLKKTMGFISKEDLKNTFEQIKKEEN